MQGGFHVEETLAPRRDARHRRHRRSGRLRRDPAACRAAGRRDLRRGHRPAAHRVVRDAHGGRRQPQQRRGGVDLRGGAGRDGEHDPGGRPGERHDGERAPDRDDVGGAGQLGAGRLLRGDGAVRGHRAQRRDDRGCLRRRVRPQRGDPVRHELALRACAAPGD